jgi:hypothetical protein
VQDKERSGYSQKRHYHRCLGLNKIQCLLNTLNN